LGSSFINHDNGFLEYIIKEKECFICELYIEPEYRETGVGSMLADKLLKIAQGYECEVITCRTDLDQLVPEAAVKAILAYGFKISGAADNKIFYYMEV
jgi:ribosomal protein S18 acetylase RimI-like enzyme